MSFKLIFLKSNPFTNSGQDDNISHFLRPSQHGGTTKSRFYDGVVSDGVIRNTCRVMVMAPKIGVLFKPLSRRVLPLSWPMCWHKFRGNKKTQHRDSNSATSTKTTGACVCVFWDEPLLHPPSFVGGSSSRYKMCIDVDSSWRKFKGGWNGVAIEIEILKPSQSSKDDGIKQITPQKTNM